MAKVYRVMFANGVLPKVGSNSYNLGVRVPPDPYADVTPDSSGTVTRCGDGMSVNPGISKMPSFIMPVFSDKDILLNDEYQRGRNRRHVSVFILNDVQFDDVCFTTTTINSVLLLTPNDDKHGIIQPADTTSIASFQADLAATVNDWVLLPVPDGS